MAGVKGVGGGGEGGGGGGAIGRISPEPLNHEASRTGIKAKKYLLYARKN